MPSLTIDTPFGPLTVVEKDGAVVRVAWEGDGRDRTPVLIEAEWQIEAYCAGEIKTFDLPLRVEGSGVQQAVCGQIAAIPYGETVTYGEIAKTLAMGRQAVGSACGRNPIPVIIPCHRVMGAKGLTGFSGKGGVETKLALLRHEGAGGFLI